MAVVGDLVQHRGKWITPAPTHCAMVMSPQSLSVSACQLPFNPSSPDDLCNAVSVLGRNVRGMEGPVQYCVASAIDPASAEIRFVIVGSDEVLHHEASRWLEFLLALGRSPNTIRRVRVRRTVVSVVALRVVDRRSIQRCLAPRRCGADIG